MGRRVWFGVAALCAFGAFKPSHAQAEPASKRSAAPAPSPEAEFASRRSSWSGDRLALLAQAGIAAPAGDLNLSLDFAPIEALALNVGAGPGMSGWQFAVLPRVRIATKPGTYFTFGIGPSFGRYVNSMNGAGLLAAFSQMAESPAEQTFRRAVWLNVELGLDLYSNGGRGLGRFTLGLGELMNPHDFKCEPLPDHQYSSSGGCDRTSGQSLLFIAFAYGLDI